MSGPTSSDDDWSSPNYLGSGVQVGDSRPDSDDDSDWSTPTTRDAGPRRGSAPPRESTSRRDSTSPRDSAPPRGSVPERDSTAVWENEPQDASARGSRHDEPNTAAEGWSSGPVSAREQRATRLAERRDAQDARRTERSMQDLRERTTPAVRPFERGLVWWAALAILIGITLAGAILDSVASIQNQNAFNIAIVLGSIAGILLVKRSQMFAIVVSPPIVYALAAVLQLYLKKSLSQDKHGALNAILNAVQNYLVYGFPALATATAAVLIIAGIRMVMRRQHAQPQGYAASPGYAAPPVR